jgi:hypothetical protein
MPEADSLARTKTRAIRASAPQAQEAADLDFVIVLAVVIVDDDMAELLVAPAARNGPPDLGELAVFVHSQFGPSALPQSLDGGSGFDVARLP